MKMYHFKTLQKWEGVRDANFPPRKEIMTAAKFMIIIIILSVIIITLVLWLTAYDINKAKEAISLQEHKEFKQIPDGVDEAKIKELVREADLSAFRLEQHRQELEKLLEIK